MIDRDKLPVLGQIETVYRCKECLSEVIPVINLRDNDIQVSCEKCKVTEFISRANEEIFFKHFRMDMYLAGVLLRTRQ